MSEPVVPPTRAEAAVATGPVLASAPVQRRGPWTGAAIATAWKATTDRRASFALQMSFMVVNDLSWVVFWVFVFHGAGNVRGWNLSEVLVLFSIVTASFGLSLGLFAGVRDAARLVHSDEFDAMLAQPRPALARIVLRRIDAPVLGDLVFGPVLFALSGHASLATWPVYVAVVVASALLMLGFTVATQATIFFLKGRSEVNDIAFNAIMVFSMYPADMFGGGLQALIYTVIPAAFIGTVPVGLVLHPGWNDLLSMLAILAATWAIAAVAWRAGIRRYLRDGLA